MGKKNRPKKEESLSLDNGSKIGKRGKKRMWEGSVSEEEWRNRFGGTYNHAGRYTGGAAVAETKASDPVMDEVERALAQEMCSYHLTKEEALASTKPTRYFLDGSGVKVYRTVDINGNTLKIISDAKGVAGLPKIPNSVEVEIVEKMPYDLMRGILASFKAVYNRDQTEAACQIYRNRETREYFVYYPHQENSGGASDYKKDDEAMINLRQIHDFVCEIHSHANMGAFFSGTDDANEKASLTYVVFGGFAGTVAQSVARLRSGEHEKRLELKEIFDIPEDVMVPLSLAELPEPSAVLLERAKKAHSGAVTEHQGTSKYYEAQKDWNYGFQRPPIGFDRDASGRFLPYNRGAAPPYQPLMSLEWMVGAMTPNDFVKFFHLYVAKHPEVLKAKEEPTMEEAAEKAGVVDVTPKEEVQVG